MRKLALAVVVGGAVLIVAAVMLVPDRKPSSPKVAVSHEIPGEDGGAKYLGLYAKWAHDQYHRVHATTPDNLGAGVVNEKNFWDCEYCDGKKYYQLRIEVVKDRHWSLPNVSKELFDAVKIGDPVPR